jgi:hypothetical protein
MCDTTSRAARGSVGSRPRWGLLYAATLPQLAALGVVELTQSTQVVRVALRYLLALAVFLAMGAWLRANRAAFDLLDWCDCAGQQMTVRVIESRRPRPIAVPLDLPAILPAPAEEEYEVSGRRGPG